MAGNFVTASTQYLRNSATPVTTYPITVGAWLNLRAVNTVARILWAVSDTATTNNYLAMGMSPTEILRIVSRAGGTETSTSVTTALTAATWVFCLCRFISATAKRISVLFHNGLIEHAQNTTSHSPAGIDSMTIGANFTSSGALNPWDGFLGEFWFTDTDIQPDGLVTQNDMLRQLAFGGPFSVPHIVKDIIEYHSMRKDPISCEIGEIYYGKFGVQTWANNNGVTIGPHPPFPYWRVRPDSRRVIPPWLIDMAGGAAPPAATPIIRHRVALLGAGR